MGAGMRAPPPAACAPCGLGRGRAFPGVGRGDAAASLGHGLRVRREEGRGASGNGLTGRGSAATETSRRRTKETPSSVASASASATSTVGVFGAKTADRDRGSRARAGPHPARGRGFLGSAAHDIRGGGGAAPLGRRGGRRGGLRGGGESRVQPPRAPTIWRARWGAEGATAGAGVAFAFCAGFGPSFRGAGSPGPALPPLFAPPVIAGREAGSGGRSGASRRAVVETRTRRNGAGIGAGRNVPGLPSRLSERLSPRSLRPFCCAARSKARRSGACVVRGRDVGREPVSARRGVRTALAECPIGWMRVAVSRERSPRLARLSPTEEPHAPASAFSRLSPPPRTSPLLSRGRGGRGGGGVSSGRRAPSRGKIESSRDRHLVFPRADHSGKRAVRGARTVHQRVGRRVHVSVVLLQHRHHVLGGLAGDRRQRLDVVLSRHRVRPLRVSRSVLLLSVRRGCRERPVLRASTEGLSERPCGALASSPSRSSEHGVSRVVPASRGRGNFVGGRARTRKSPK